MISLITVTKAQQKVAEYMRKHRLNQGLTQEGLSERSGVSLPTLRKFEQKGLISLESFFKLAIVLNCLESLVNALEPVAKEYSSIDDVVNDQKVKEPKRGWRK